MITPQLASPCELKDIGRYVVDDGWVLEQKLDGHRVMLYDSGNGTEPVAITRNGTVYSKGLPTSVRNFRFSEFTGAVLVLDGELVGDTYWVFDILRADGTWNGLPMEDRRQALELFLKTFSNPFKLVPQARTTEEKERLLLHAAEHCLEGVVIKRKTSRYFPGQRSKEWLKGKFVCTADVVIAAVRDDGKESAALAIIKDGKPVEVGRCSLIGKPAVKVGDVVEVKYLYIPDGAKPRLYQPTLLRVRQDKDMLDCDGSDFKVTNKNVLEVLP